MAGEGFGSFYGMPSGRWEYIAASLVMALRCTNSRMPCMGTVIMAREGLLQLALHGIGQGGDNTVSGSHPQDC